ncbi:hypothetical protein COLO4_17675 [Corchorus olitorius]|uniref:ABC-type xenobiotic transporter n=1 Tax=Corchorus olitorius TaxID=93759 RepID=A0A1R3JBX2_9ROSI|nr:hypothetical protein COLO4_17675 [Corchorus olitorius]
MAFEPLVWYCQPVANAAWAKEVDAAFGAYTPCAIDSVVISVSNLVLLGLCCYRIWLIKKNSKVQRFCLRSKRYNYLLAFLAGYCTIEPLVRLFMGVSIFNLNGETGLAPYEATSLIIEATAWCSVLIMIGLETKAYIREFRWYVRFGVVYVLVGDAVLLNLILGVKDLYSRWRFHGCWFKENQRSKPWLLRALNGSLGGSQCNEVTQPGLVAAIFHKSLRLTREARKNFSSGKITNMITTDANALQFNNFILNTIPVTVTFASAKVSLQRLEELFLAEERVLEPNPPLQPGIPAISIKDGNFSWDAKAEKLTLSDINLDVPVGSLVAIVGGTGEGKTSLISAMLGELPPHMNSSVVIRGTVAYVPQVSWIFNASVRDNILFGYSFQTERYRKTIDVTALRHDLDDFDLTEIGERGVNISGGQKQRISMARAVYSNSDVYIFDDPLSALDAHVAHEVFHRCIKEALQGKTRILVTNQLHFLPHVDRILLVFDGRIKEEGTLEEISKKGKLFQKLMENAGKLEKQREGKQDGKIFEEDLKPTSDGMVEINELLKNANPAKTKKERKALLVKQEERETGVVSWKVLMRYKDALGGLWVVSTSREVKRLDSITRSPVYAQFGEVLNGLSSIRAYQAYDRVAVVNGKSMDNNIRFTLANMSSNRWLAIRLETLGGLMIWLTATITVWQNGKVENQSAFASTMGLLLSYTLNISSLLSGVLRQASRAENSLNAVERVGTYINLPLEAPDLIVSHRPPPGWPSSGLIQFADVFLRYRPELPPVLSGLSFTASPCEKLGIVGRTGAGKSSVLNALFRIVELEKGRILIDGCNIARFGLTDLRKVLSIIPQSPVLFSGTVRLNLDPFSEHDDPDLWEALERAHLKDVIRRNFFALDAEVLENGDNFSVGQRQLLCLARALLRRSKILVLDEATAAVDVKTDAFIQKTIREEFKSCTMLIVAHRLNTIIDCDRILVLDAGQVVEQNTPQELLANEESTFSKMVQSTGPANAEYVRSLVFGCVETMVDVVRPKVKKYGFQYGKDLEGMDEELSLEIAARLIVATTFC